MGIVEWLTVVPGGVALVGAIIGYGEMRNRVNTLKTEVEKLDNLIPTVARIDERTKSTEKAVSEMGKKIDRLVDQMMRDTRSSRRPT